MAVLANLSIRQKLQAIITLTSSAALLLACGAAAAYTVADVRQSMRRDLAVLAQMLGENSSAALVFQDRRAASDLLNGLRVQQRIVAAAIYSKEGGIFARYTRPGTS